MIVVIPVKGQVTVALSTGALVLRSQISLDILPDYFCLETDFASLNSLMVTFNFQLLCYK